MSSPRLHFVQGLACLVLSLSAQASSAEAIYPAHAVTMVVPFPAGGSLDTVARAIAPKLGELLQQNIIVDNRPGAGTLLGAGYAAKAAPDGYTLLLASGSTLTLNPVIRKSLPYDSVKSFEPIGMVARTGMVFLAHAAVPVNNLNELRAAAKNQPGRYAFGSFGAGTTSHFVGEMAFHAMGIELTHVPYKGSAPEMTDLIGGQVPFSVDTVTAAAPQIRAGTIKALAVASAHRLPALPHVPTFAESGYPDVVLDSWCMLLAPRGLTPQVSQKLQKALAATLADPGVRKTFAEQSLEPSPSSPAEAARQIESELPLVRAVAVRANIQPE